MLNLRHSMLLLACGLLSGCMTLDSIHNLSLNPQRSFPIPSHGKGYLATVPGWAKEEALATPRGSLVSIVIDDKHNAVGILTNINGDVMELTHCVSRETVAAPDGGQQCQRSYQSSRSFNLSLLQHFQDITHITPSPDEFRKTALRQLNQCPEIDTIELMNGRHLQIPDPTTLEYEPRTNEEIARSLSRVPPGSEICLLDESDRCMNAVIVKIDTETETVELMNCITQEPVSDSRERPQKRTIHTPLETLELTAIKSFRTIAASPPDIELSEDDIDCRAYVAAAFLTRNGNRYCWDETYSLNSQH